jgi:hypothetical protein
MPELFDRDALDALAADCGAAPAPWSARDPVTLSGRCHPGAPSTYRVDLPWRIEAACATCARPFAVLMVDLAGEGGWVIHHPECNRGRAAAAVALSYARGSGVVRVACAGCGEILGAFPIRRRLA